SWLNTPPELPARTSGGRLCALLRLLWTLDPARRAAAAAARLAGALQQAARRYACIRLQWQILEQRESHARNRVCARGDRTVDHRLLEQQARLREIRLC